MKGEFVLQKKSLKLNELCAYCLI